EIAHAESGTAPKAVRRKTLKRGKSEYFGKEFKELVDNSPDPTSPTSAEDPLSPSLPGTASSYDDVATATTTVTGHRTHRRKSRGGPEQHAQRNSVRD